MGTSQSLSLKKTPQWSSAKRAMTGVIRNPEDGHHISSFMKKFLNALGEDGLYRGYGNFPQERYDTRGAGRHSFGSAGSKATKNLVNFISSVRSVGISPTLSLLITDPEQRPQTPQELIYSLCIQDSIDTDATFDEGAAAVAKKKVLAEMFKECATLDAVEEMLKQVDEATINKWIIDFEVEYIVEYQASLFQSLIFDKGVNPAKICAEIKRWLHRELDRRLSDEMAHINVFSEEGARYIDTLTSRILEIWQQ